MSQIVARPLDSPDASPSTLSLSSPSREQVWQQIRSLPVVRDWSELARLTERPFLGSDGTIVSWEYPRLACEALGASPEAALPAMGAVACLQLAIGVVDDMLDDDPDGIFHHLGTGRAANLAAASQALASQLLARAPVSPRRLAAAQEVLARAALGTAYGQELDVSDHDDGDDEARYWRVTDAKTPPLFGGAFALGALLGGADLDQARGFEALGLPLGRMIQVSDDLNDALESPACPDWRRPRTNLALLYAEIAEHEDRQRFREIVKHLGDDSTALGEARLEEAQQILVRCGAASYCCYRLLDFHRELRQAVDSLAPSRPEPLLRLADEQIRPVVELFEAHGLSLPDLEDFETAARRDR